MSKRYRARCNTHDWEGHTRDERSEAKADLESHTSDETYSGGHQTEILQWDEKEDE